MLSIFKKSKKSIIDIGNIVQHDMHSHILPGIDDGAPDIATSITLIKGMMQNGFKTFMGTPHVMAELHKNTRETIEDAYAKLNAALQEQGMNIKLKYAAEYMIDENFLNLVAAGNMLTITENKILMETPFYHEPLDIENVLFTIETAGYTAILAHPERYHFVDEKLKVLDKYLDHHCDLQINLLSLTGYYGPREKAIAERIIDAGIASYLGSDLHHERHLKRLQHFELDAKIVKKLENIDWKNRELG